MIHWIYSDSSRWENIVALKTCGKEGPSPRHFITYTCIHTLVMCTFHLSITSETVPTNMLHQRIPLTWMYPRSTRAKAGAPCLQCPSGPAISSTLTRTTSSSLFLCMSCFSSSTILDMASFSVSCSFSDNCKVLKGNLGHNTRALCSGPQFSESGAQKPFGAHQGPACVPQAVFWKCEYF